ncbi:hypothetical protein EDB86DRAFT_2971587, partial [Lactarius hatsudake]
MRRRVGLALEWWWWLAVRVHVWEWRWWASVEVGGGHGGQRHTRLGKKKGLAEAESGAWETVLCGVGKCALTRRRVDTGHPSTYVLQHFKLQASTFNVQHCNVSTTEQLNWYCLACGPPLYSRENIVAGTQSTTPPRPRARTTATPPPHSTQPPPLRHQHTNDDGDAVVPWWEQHGGRIDGGGDVAAAAGMAMVACQEQWQRGGNGSG